MRNPLCSLAKWWDQFMRECFQKIFNFCGKNEKKHSILPLLRQHVFTYLNVIGFWNFDIKIFNQMWSEWNKKRLSQSALIRKVDKRRKLCNILLCFNTKWPTHYATLNHFSVFCRWAGQNFGCTRNEWYQWFLFMPRHCLIMVQIRIVRNAGGYLHMKRLDKISPFHFVAPRPYTVAILSKFSNISLHLLILQPWTMQ